MRGWAGAEASLGYGVVQSSPEELRCKRLGIGSGPREAILRRLSGLSLQVARRRAQAGASLLQLGLAALGGTAITNRS